MRKIVAINGSHRGTRGLTHALLDEIQQGVKDCGGHFEMVTLAEHAISQCRGCEVCHTEKSYLRCVYEDKDDVRAIFDKMAEADIIIYATPIYIFTMSSLLKKFLDRLNSTGDTGILQVSRKGLIFHHINRDICSKPFMLLTVCGNIENETSRNVVSYFKTFSSFMDASMVGTVVRTSAFLLHNKDLRELPLKAKILNAFNQAGRELVLQGRLSTSTRRKTTQRVIDMPIFGRILMKIRPLKSKLIGLAVKKGAIHYR